MIACVNVMYGGRVLTFNVDQQVGQLYELMQAIRKQELEDNDPETKSGDEK